jgi:hypothetical protein
MEIRPASVVATLCVFATALVLCASASEARVERIAPGPNAPVERFLRTYLRDQTGNIDNSTRVSIASIRDEGAAIDDIVVYVSGQGWCGSGGCRLFVLTPKDSTFRVLGKMTIVQLPVQYLRTTTNGHADLAVRVAGGGILHGHYAKLTFDGHTYPSNPSMPPAEPIPTPHGEILFPTTARGTLLYP